MYLSLFYAVHDVFRMDYFREKNSTKTRGLIVYIFIFFHLKSQTPAETKGTSKKHRFCVWGPDKWQFFIISPATAISIWISKGCNISCLIETAWHEKNQHFTNSDAGLSMSSSFCQRADLEMEMWRLEGEKSSVSSSQDEFEKPAFNDSCKEPQRTGSLNLWSFRHILLDDVGCAVAADGFQMLGMVLLQKS